MSHDWLRLGSFDPSEFSRLWLLAVTFYGVGDIVTTVAILQQSALVSEANPLLRAVYDSFGLSGFVGLKLAAFGLGIAVSLHGDRHADRFVYLLPPATLAVVGAFTTALNLRLLIG